MGQVGLQPGQAAARGAGRAPRRRRHAQRTVSRVPSAVRRKRRDRPSAPRGASGREWSRFRGKRTVECIEHGQGCQAGTHDQGERLRPRSGLADSPPAASDAPDRSTVGAGPGATRPRSCWAAAGSPGGVYEIGALRALDLLAVNSTVNQFDVYVGTSAGSFIAALCANGVTPEEMMRVVTRQGKAALQRHRHRRPAAPQPDRVRAQGRPAAAARALARAPGGLPAGRRVADGRRAGARGRVALRARTRAPGSRATCTRCSVSRAAPTTSGSWPASST